MGRRGLLFLPLILVMIVALLLYQAISTDPTYRATSSDRVLPSMRASDLWQSDKQLSEQDLLGKIALLHVWASWCQVCQVENNFLLQLQQQRELALYGLNYRDDRLKAIAWLTEVGNAYQQIFYDPNGELALELGTYGTPESYLINCQGRIIYHYLGPLNEQIWQREFQPRINQLINDKEAMTACVNTY